MYGPYHLKAMIDQRHDEAQREAQTRRLAKQARAATNRRGSRLAGPAWRSVDRRAPAALSLALLALVVVLAASGCGDAPPSLDYTEDTYQEDTYQEDTYQEDTHQEDTYGEDTHQEDAYREGCARKLL